MARSRTHKDVEYMVDWARPRPGRERSEMYFKTADEASSNAIARAISTGEPVHIDVLVSSRAGARWYGGDYGVEQYEEDPEVSVFERIEVRADSQGRVP